MKRLSNKTWLISDTHFGHAKAIQMCDRPFKDKHEMDEVMISNWNKKIKNGHDVFFLGDFSFYGKDKATEICKKLNGNKYMIKGNHDSHSVEYYQDCGFKRVYDFPIILENFWVLSHEPIPFNDDTMFFNIHGHLHNNVTYEQREESTTHYCVSVELLDYKPIDFDKVRDIAMCRIERRENGVMK